MKLIKGQKYWCGWASRYAYYVKPYNRYNTIKGEREFIHKFSDVCGQTIECDDRYIAKWVKEA